MSSPGRNLEVDSEESFEFAEIKLLAPIKVGLKCTGFDDGSIAVCGQITAQVEQICSRCASPYCEHVVTDIDELFVPKDSPKLKESEHSKEIEASELCVFAYEGNSLDLDEVVRQNLLASLPFCPLCREDCRGLCAGCGVDLNKGECTCSKEKEPDPRWAGLKRFMVDKEADKE